MRIILIGPPGSGKGTQASWISKHYSISQIGTGDMLRKIAAESSLLGRQIASLLTNGQLIQNKIVVDLIKNRIAESDCQTGFILDGFPRTIAQAKMITEIIEIDLVIEFAVPDAVITERLSGRRIHPASGRVYHIHYYPPKVANQDDITKEPLLQRFDDTESAIKQRLDIYHKQTRAVTLYYEQLSKHLGPSAPKYYKIDSDKSIEVVRQQIQPILNNL